MITIASKFSLNSSSEEVTLNSNYENSASSLATSLMHDINFPGNKSRKVISPYFSASSNHHKHWLRCYPLKSFDAPNCYISGVLEFITRRGFRS